MGSFPKQYRILAWLSLILVAGFLATTLASYLVSRDTIRHGIAEEALPLTSDNIYSEIQKDLLRPVFISSLMAQDTFVRDWILDGERDPDQITRYLKEVKEKYGTITSFLVSEKSRRYYYADGILKSVQADEPRDAWFFRVRTLKAPYETNVDPDMANRDAMTVFINYRVFDYQGNFIGAAGVGLTLDAVSRLIESYQARFQRRIFFTDRAGTIVLAGKSMEHLRGSVRDLPGIRDVATELLQTSPTPVQASYRLEKATVLVNSRFIPELGWHLVVEQSDRDEVRPVQQVFLLNLAVSAGITLLVLAIILMTVNRYQRRLEHTAATDSLTGLINRQAFEFVFRQSLEEANRTGQPLSVILFDADFFKRVNDTHGHLAGDRVLQAMARLAKQAVRGSDVVARWGGEEFLILVRDCALDQAQGVAEKLRRSIAAYDFGLYDPRMAITVSLGVAQYQPEESADSFFARADQVLYLAKEKGRNRTEPEVTQATGAA
jgi:diguanylate cyclase (GGDEF)-like protein